MKSELLSYVFLNEWLKHNRKISGTYAGEWIAFTRSGVIVHHPGGHIVARKTQQDYALKYVHPLEVSRIVRIVPIRVR